MKRVTILLDDEDLYRSVKAQAAREGRSIKAAVEEAFRMWLGGRDHMSKTEATRMQNALDALDRIRKRHPALPAGTVSDLIWEAREERFEAILDSGPSVKP